MGSALAGLAGLARRHIRVAPGAPLRGIAGAGGELWFMIAGSGRLDVGALRGAAVRADTGCWMPPGSRYRLDAGEDVRLDAVALPAAPAAAGAPDGPLLSELAACEVERTGERRFRMLLGPGRGCQAATQFVGEIPPGRAPVHSHPYDEVVLVLRGEGVAHAGGIDRALGPGTSVHLPRGLPHCLENTGRHTLTVLGVFHPGGSPAAKSAGSTP